jgi:hypothetical protein
VAEPDGIVTGVAAGAGRLAAPPPTVVSGAAGLAGFRTGALALGAGTVAAGAAVSAAGAVAALAGVAAAGVLAVLAALAGDVAAAGACALAASGSEKERMVSRRAVVVSYSVCGYARMA